MPHHASVGNDFVDDVGNLLNRFRTRLSKLLVENMSDLAMLREYFRFHCLASQFIIQLIFTCQEGEQPHSQGAEPLPIPQSEGERWTGTSRDPGNEVGR